MASDILTYSPSDVKIIVCGYILTGVMSVSLTWNGSKPFSVVKGIRGSHTRVYNPDLYASVTVEVLQTSITNDVLTSIVTQDRNTGSARLEFNLIDTSGTTNLQSTDCFVSGFPEALLNDSINTYRWTFECLSFNSGLSIGGNARQGFDILDPVNGAIDYLTNSFN